MEAQVRTLHPNTDLRPRCLRQLKALQAGDVITLDFSPSAVILFTGTPDEPTGIPAWIIGRRAVVQLVGGNPDRISEGSGIVDVGSRRIFSLKASQLVLPGLRGLAGWGEGNLFVPFISHWLRDGSFVLAHDRGLPPDSPLAPSRLIEAVRRIGGRARFSIWRVKATPDRVKLGCKSLDYIETPDEFAHCDRSSLSLGVWRNLAAGCDVFGAELRVSSVDLWDAAIESTPHIIWERDDKPCAVQQRLAVTSNRSAADLQMFPKLFTEPELVDVMSALLRI